MGAAGGVWTPGSQTTLLPWHSHSLMVLPVRGLGHKPYIVICDGERQGRGVHGLHAVAARSALGPGMHPRTHTRMHAHTEGCTHT